MRNRAYRRHQRARARARHLRDLRINNLRGVTPARGIAVTHPYDCRPCCLLCHWSKFLEPRRARERREWMRSLERDAETLGHCSTVETS